ncbi:DUF4397 domain-containing protein [Halosegnis longus]|uniref:DUF4397 domain-containing protein n=1 Tax=Halosegnis longus TaxID=2216012 RepID=UPI00129EF8BE|nr:DUF4397 domain-containing protein [Halosegnis longus]
MTKASAAIPAVSSTCISIIDRTASNGNAVFDGVAYGESGYATVPAGDYTLDIRGDTENNDGEVVASYDVSLSGGEVYSAVAVGYLSPDNEPADTNFDLVVSPDTMQSTDGRVSCCCS